MHYNKDHTSGGFNNCVILKKEIWFYESISCLYFFLYFNLQRARLFIYNNTKNVLIKNILVNLRPTHKNSLPVCPIGFIWDPKMRKYPVSGSCVDENALLMSEENGQTG